ncbi:MAG TPA: hypothetical protein VMW32_01530, partial [Bacteroidales bacterium]|nr:hypothetical protein [Bacteroidales bacterium]
MATNRNGDSLYIGTEGAGVARVYQNIDAISGASGYARWGPIILPSDKNGKYWFGTKGGVSVFDGSAWTSFTIDDGLNSNNVLCISFDDD